MTSRFSKTVGISIGVIATLLLGACAAEPNGAGDSEGEEWAIGHVGGSDAPYELAAQGFVQAVAEGTDGAVKINTFPSGQLGGERDMAEQVQLGSLEMVITSTGAVSAFVPELGGLELPFLFEGPEEAWGALDGALGDYLNAKLKEAGFVNLGYWEFGFKNITNSARPIEQPSDMNGLTMRVLENSVLIDTYRAMGADPTPIPFPETYTALQQGVADGFEGPYINFVDGNLYEVQSYLSEVRINYGAVVVLVNKALFDGLDSSTQDTLRAAGAQWTAEQRRINGEKATEYKTLVVEDGGVEIIEFDDLNIDAFRDATASVYDGHPEFAEVVRLAKEK